MDKQSHEDRSLSCLMVLIGVVSRSYSGVILTMISVVSHTITPDSKRM